MYLLQRGKTKIISVQDKVFILSLCKLIVVFQGMRIVESPKEFVDAFLGAQREAAASFGVNTILLEKYITRPRHIEVQVIFNYVRGYFGSNFISISLILNFIMIGIWGQTRQCCILIRERLQCAKKTPKDN